MKLTQLQLCFNHRLTARVCTLFLGAFWFGVDVIAAPSEPEDVLIARCNQNIAESCLDMGNKDTDAIGKPTNLARGLLFFEKACSLGRAHACTLAALGHYTAKGSPTRDLMKAISYGTKACDGDDAVGCYNLGTVYKNATGLPNYAERAAALYARSCTLGSLIACGISNHVATVPALSANAASTNSASATPSQNDRNCLNEANYEACWLASRGSSESNYARSNRHSSGTAPRETITPRTPDSIRFGQSCNPRLPAGCLTAGRLLAGQANNADGQAEGRIVCTSSNSITRRFSYTNSFAGIAERLSQYRQSYVSMESSLRSRLTGMGVGKNAFSESPEMNCTWHANQTDADMYIDRAVAQAQRDQMTTSRTYFVTN